MKMYTNTGCEVEVEDTADGAVLTTPVGAKVTLIEPVFIAGDGALGVEYVIEEDPNDATVRLFWDREACPDVPLA